MAESRDVDGGIEIGIVLKKHELELVDPLFVNRNAIIGSLHYNLISDLHKFMRGSDVDASIYWLARILEGGEQPQSWRK